MINLGTLRKCKYKRYVFVKIKIIKYSPLVLSWNEVAILVESKSEKNDNFVCLILINNYFTLKASISALF